MPSTYVHLSLRDIDGAILKLHGLKEDKEEKKENLTPKKCFRCEKMNPATGKFCLRCGAPLDLETVMKVDEKRKEIDQLKKENNELKIWMPSFKEGLKLLAEKVDSVIKVAKQREEEMNKLREENTFLKELLDKDNADWIIMRDLAIRTNRVPDEPNEFGYPLNFDEEKVYNLQPNEENSKRKEIKQTHKKSKTLKFDSPESLLTYFKETLGRVYYEYSRIDTIARFIFENIDKPFGREDVGNYCKNEHGKKPSDATTHKHLNLLIEHDIIRRKYHGVYEVNKLLLNFH